MNGDFGIDFENQIAKFEIRPGSADQVAEWRKRHPKESEKIPEAEWPLEIGYIMAVGKTKTFRPKSAALEQAVKALVECRDTPFHKVARTCARAVGMMLTPQHGDPMDEWRSSAHKLRLMFKGINYIYDKNWRATQVRWPHPAAQEVGEIGIFLVPGPDGKPTLSLKPQELEAALTLCAARMIATGTTFTTCLNCKSPFLRGGQSDRRGDAVFCNSRCKSEYHNKERRKTTRETKS
jgi:hypothetical protein